jgi:hypothetical protein
MRQATIQTIKSKSERLTNAPLQNLNYCHSMYIKLVILPKRLLHSQMFQSLLEHCNKSLI